MPTLLFPHILLAILSILWVTFTLYRPARERLQFSYIMAGAVLLSGAGLTLTTGQNIVQSCVMGLFYLGVVMLGAHAARKRLLRS